MPDLPLPLLDRGDRASRRALLAQLCVTSLVATLLLALALLLLVVARSYPVSTEISYLEFADAAGMEAAQQWFAGQPAAGSSRPLAPADWQKILGLPEPTATLPLPILVWQMPADPAPVIAALRQQVPVLEWLSPTILLQDIRWLQLVAVTMALLLACLSVLAAGLGVVGAVQGLWFRQQEALRLLHSLGADDDQICRLLRQFLLPPLQWGVVGGGVGAALLLLLLAFSVMPLGLLQPWAFGFLAAGLATVGLPMLLLAGALLLVEWRARLRLRRWP